MKRGVYGILSLAFFGGTQVYAQQSVIEIASEITMLCDCDQVEDGDTMKYKYSIVNSGDGAMTVPYVFWNGNGYTLVGTFDHNIKVTNEFEPLTPIEYSWINDEEAGVAMSINDPATKEKIEHILPGDTAVVYVEDVVMMSTRHKEGNNTIVVWPENHGGLTIPDSLKYQIEVINDSNNAAANGVETTWIQETKIFPNPAKTQIIIQIPGELRENIQEITIHNAHGQEVKKYDGSYLEFNIEDLATGHYTVNFVLENQSKFAKPLIVRTK